MEEIANKAIYCLKMMGLASWMHEQINDGYVRRVIGRLHFIYLDAFLVLVPQLKNLIKKNGKDVRQPEVNLRRLQVDYDSAFADIRDKLAAHRQDKPLGEVIEDWNEIQEYSIQTLTEDAEKIYAALSNEEPLLPRFSSSVDVGNNQLREHLASTTDTKDAPASFGNDTFAITRPNTLVSLPVGPTMTCNKRIISILDMLNVTLSLLHQLPTTADVERLLKASAVVDVCSLLDALYPNPGANGHASPNLLELTTSQPGINNNALMAAINTRDQVLEAKLREARNKIAAHVDKAQDIEASIALLDGLSIAEIIEAGEAIIQGYDAFCRDNHIMFHDYFMHRRPLPASVRLHS